VSDLQKVSNWMLERSYATGHGTSVVDLLQELEWQVAEREREACAKVAEFYEPRCDSCPRGVATAIRSRGIDAAIVGEVGVWGDTAPPKREWVGLTDEDLEPMCDDWRIVFGPYVYDFARAIEATLKEKNT
jgi:hypothetical protein